MPKVSVIIPVYNVSRFIKRCAESLLMQTMKDVEFIFVDDASPDDSVEIIKSVISFHSDRDVRIIYHSENQGLPSARNTGLFHAKGDYIFHCDGDDWVEPDLIEKLYSAAVDNNVDYVYCDFYLTFENGERYMRNPEYSTIEDYLGKGLLSGTTKYNVWNKLVKRSLYVDNNILFPEGHAMGEDMTMIRLAARAKNVKYVPEALYHYIKINGSAYTQSMSAKQLDDIRYNADETISFLKNLYGDDINTEIEFFKLNIKLPFLLSNSRSDYSIWCTWYPESNGFIMQNHSQSIRTRILQWFASYHIWMIVRSYNRIVDSIYQVLYR